MTFDEWYLREYPALAYGQSSIKAALEAAYEAGIEHEAEANSYPPHPNSYPD